MVRMVRHHDAVQHGDMALQPERCNAALASCRMRLCTWHQARCTEVKWRPVQLVQDHGSAGSVASVARGTRASRGRDHLLTAWSQTTASEQADRCATITTAVGLSLRHVSDEPVTDEVEAEAEE